MPPREVEGGAYDCTEDHPVGEAELPSTVDAHAMWLDAVPHPLEQLRLVAPKLVHLVLEDESPRQSEDELLLAVEEVLRADVDELDAL